MLYMLNTKMERKFKTVFHNDLQAIKDNECKGAPSVILCSFLIQHRCVKCKLRIMSEHWATTVGSVAKREICHGSMEILGQSSHVVIWRVQIRTAAEESLPPPTLTL
jgi:hypothetical protein